MVMDNILIRRLFLISFALVLLIFATPVPEFVRLVLIKAGAQVGPPELNFSEYDSRKGPDINVEGPAGNLRFSTLGDVVTSVKSWYPSMQHGDRGAGIPLANIDRRWPVESIAFYLTWTCLPSAATVSPNIDPFMSAIWRDMNDFKRCSIRSMEEYAKAVPAAERAALLDQALLIIRTRVTAGAMRTTCKEKGADDCVLGLLILSSLAPADMTLDRALHRVEAVLEKSPELVHDARRYALTKVRSQIAIESLAGQPKSSMGSKIVDSIEPYFPKSAAAVRSALNVQPGRVDWSKERSDMALSEGLDQDILLRANAASQRNGSHGWLSRYEPYYYAWPLSHVEYLPIERRKVIVAALTDEVVRRAGTEKCNTALAEGIDRHGDWVRSDEQLVLMAQLSFLYASLQSKRTPEGLCGSLAIPEKGGQQDWYLDVTSILASLVWDENRPFLHAKAMRQIEAWCAEHSQSAICEKLPRGDLDFLKEPGGLRYHASQIASTKELPEDVSSSIDNHLLRENCRPISYIIWKKLPQDPVVVDVLCESVEKSDDADELPAKWHLWAEIMSAKVSLVGAHDGSSYQWPGAIQSAADFDGDGRPEIQYLQPSYCEEGTSPSTCGKGELHDGEVFGGRLIKYDDNRLRR